MSVYSLLDFMPQNLLQPSVPFNKDMQVVAALLAPVIEDMGLTAPPVTVSGDVGKTWIPATGATGAWAGHEEQIALCTAPTLWVFLQPPAELRARVLKINTVPENVYYRWNGTAWVDDSAAGMVPEAPNDGQRYVRLNEAWSAFLRGVAVDNGGAISGQALTLLLGSGLVLADLTGGVFGISASPPAVVNTATANTNAGPSNAGAYTRFSNAAATYSFDSGTAFVVGAEYHGRNVGTGTLTITAVGSMVINAPADGTLVIPPQGTFTVKIVAAAEADLMGITEAA